MKIILFLATLICSILNPNYSYANVITVNTDTDIIADDGFCSLREAVEASRISSSSGDRLGECISGDANSVDTISFQLNFPTIIILESPLTITNSIGLNITGPGYEKLLIDAYQTQAFNVSGGQFIFSGFELSGGWSGGVGVGGALSIAADDMTLRGMKFSDSIAVRGGAVYANINTGDSLKINSCIFSNNTAFGGNAGTPSAGWGGGIFVQIDQLAELSIKNTTFQNNSADGLNYHFVDAFVDNQVVSILENIQNGYGGALFVHGEVGNGLVSGIVDITRSTFSGNYAAWQGAAISVGGSTIGTFDGDLSLSHSSIHRNWVGDRNENIIDVEFGVGVDIVTPFNGVNFDGVGSIALLNTILTGTQVINNSTDVLDVSFFMRADQLINQSYSVVGNTESPFLTVGLPNLQNSYIGNTTVGIVDANLQALSNVHGGFTAVHMPQGSQSIVIDKGNCPGESRDQRDFNNVSTGVRIKDDASNSNGPGDNCDIGSVEFSADSTNNFPPKLIEDYYHLDINTPITTTDASGSTTYTINSDNGLLANDVDLDGDSLTLSNTGVQALGNGSLELFADGTFSFTGHDLQDELSFTYDVTDGTDSRTQTAIIDLTPLPAPDAINDYYITAFNSVLNTTDEFGTVTAETNDDGALANDKPGATSIIYSIGTTIGGPYFGLIKVGGIGGTFEDNLDGLFTYTPPVGISGIATIEYSNYVFGGVGDNHATITIEVQQESIAAVDDVYTIRYDQILSEPAATGILANDVNNATLTTAGSFNAFPLGGAVILSNDGSFTYVPNGLQTGVDSFDYSVNDGGVISTASVEIHVTSPVAINDFYVMDEGETLSADDVLGLIPGTNDDGVLVNDNSVGASSVVVTNTFLVSDTLNQKIVNIYANGRLRYSPYIGEHGMGTATYTVEDDNGSHQATVEITVNYVNDNPYFYDLGDVNIAATSSSVTIDSWAHSISAGHGETGQVLNFILTPTNTTGGLSFIEVPHINQRGDLLFKTVPGSTGAIDIDVTLVDDEGGVSDVHSLSLSISLANNPPIANPLNYDAIEDEILHVSGSPYVTLISNDTDGDGNLLQVINTGFQTVNGIGGDLYLYSDGRFYYRSPADTSGVATFDYTVSDGSLTDTTTITINVAEKNDKPQLQDDPQGTFLEDETLPLIDIVNEMFSNDSAGTNEPAQNLGLAATTQETGGTVSIVQSDLQFTLDQDFNGVAFFRYEALDNGTTNGIADFKSDTAFVGYSITPVNDAPIFSAGTDYIHSPSNSNLIVSLPNWVTQVSPGAINESEQLISFNTNTTVTSGNLSFVVLPIIDDNTLAMSFTVLANTTGVAEVEISAVDDGNTSNGGENTSATHVMRIEIADSIFINGFE